jgi:hypothetical protein
VLSLNSKLNYLYYEILKEFGIDTPSYKKVKRHFDIYFIGEYNKIFVSKISQSAFNLGLGLDYYLK